jgi:hypothetical protein
MVFERWSATSYFLYFNGAAQYNRYQYTSQQEIKFDDEHAMYAILRASIKHIV